MLTILRNLTFSKISLFSFCFFLFNTFSHAQVSNILSFDGVDDYIEIAETGTGILGDFSAPHNFTIEVYFRFDGSTTKKKILSDNGDNTGFFFETNNSGGLEVGYGFGGSWWAASMGTITTGTWYHVAFTYNDDDCVDAPLVKWFLNGTLHTEHNLKDFGLCGAGFGLAANTGYATRIADSEYWTGENGEISIEYVRFWNVDRTNAEIAADYQSEDVCNESDLLLQYKFDDGTAGGNNSSITDVADCSSNGTDGSIHNMALTGSTSNFLFDNTSGVLPVELLSFDAKTQDEQVKLRWVTASEINNEGFEIQHSTDGFNWNRIDWVEGTGTTFEFQTYQFTHALPNQGINYYRLKQIDFDGAFEYSGVVSVDFSGGQNAFRIAPNPTSGTANVAFNFEDSNEKTLTIYNSIGKKVLQTDIEEEQTSIEIQLPNLTQGIYTAEIISGRSRNTKRMFIR